MRDIKFRAWFIDGENKTMDGQVMSYPEERGLVEFLNCVEDAKYVYGYDAVIMQFTGLKDSKGVDIYEGDLVRDSGQLAKISFEDGRFCWESGWEWGWIPTETCEVIGNIYETPELLK